MTPEGTRRELVAKIHARPIGMVIAITGGGSEAIGHLLSVPGGSKTVLEAIVPYSAEALVDWLGTKPEHFCTEHTARLMAMASFQRAQQLIAREPPSGRVAVGIGCTASLVSDRPKRGEHRIHVAWQTADATGRMSLTLDKDARDRATEEAVAADLVLNAIAAAAGIIDSLDLALDESERVTTNHVAAPPDWKSLFLGQRECVGVGLVVQPASLAGATANGASIAAGRRALFPGAFNPRHSAHDHMCAVAERRLEIPVEFEISIRNVDKPLLDYIEISNRLAQFGPKEQVWITIAPRFIDKARILGPATFIVGADTIRRIGDPEYYDHDAAQRDAAIKTLADLGSRFLVFGRKEGDVFHSLADLNIPASLRALCDEVPESEFREDISSTQLRAGSRRD